MVTGSSNNDHSSILWWRDWEMAETTDLAELATITSLRRADLTGKGIEVCNKQRHKPQNLKGVNYE